jgi:hypothetical protein
MTDEEKQELEALKAKDDLTEEETARVAALEANDEPLTDEEEFDQAFDDALDDKDPVDKDKVVAGEEKKKVDTGDGVQQKKEDDPQTDDSIFNDTLDSGSDSDGGEESPEQRIASIEAKLAKEIQRNSSWEGRIRAANKRADDAESQLNDKPGAVDKGASTPQGDDEDDTVLSEFIEEFPSLEKPIKLMATKIARDLVEKKMGDIKPTLDSVQDTAEQTAVDTHLGKITDAHPDWRKIHKSGVLTTWIEQQPKFMQPGLKTVLDKGSAEDIIELFTTYKKSSGQIKSTVNKTGKSAKQKAKELEAVLSSSSGPPKDKKKIAEDDFDSAWDDALAKK